MAPLAVYSGVHLFEMAYLVLHFQIFVRFALPDAAVH